MNELCRKLNGIVNMPLISEKKEQACIKSIIDAVVEVLEKVLANKSYITYLNQGG